ncbi:MAG: cation:proton antiporter [Candidatus Paceibacterota bacterium]
MTQLLPFLLILTASILFSELSNRLHLPWVIALIIGGMVIGPDGFDIFTSNETIGFLSEIGLIFLMFMAGLETKLSSFDKSRGKVLFVAFVNGVVPFLAGLGIGYLFGYGLQISFLLGIIFTSSSLAVVIPSLDARGILRTSFGQTVVATTILQDVASLILFSIFFQSVDPITSIPLPLFYALLVGLLVFMRFVIPKLRAFMLQGVHRAGDIFQQDLRAVFVILFGIVVIFELLGLHAIIAAFFAGFVLSDSISSDILKDKLRSISYGLFIPIFFITVGAGTDLSVFSNFETVGVLILVIVFGSVLSKYVSGAVSGRLAGFSIKESRILGASSIPQLSTTLAVVFSARELGLIPAEIATAMVVLSIVTTFVSPSLLSFLSKPESVKNEIQAAEG